ncbi:MAG: hypothetical protein WBR13_02465 [Allosphingosinicella sp.]
MEWAIFWAAAGVIATAVVPLLIWYLDRRKDRAAAGELSAEDAEWVIERGGDYKSLLQLLLSLDHAALPGLNDLTAGNAETKAAVFEKSTETWYLVVFRDSLVVGYWSLFSLSDRLVERLEKGVMYDYEITEAEVHSIRESRAHSLYVEMFGVHPAFEKSGRTIFRMLLNSLREFGERVQSGEVQVKAIYATGFSDHGAALARAFGLEALVPSIQGGHVYRTLDVGVPMRKLETLRHRRVHR